MHMSWGLHTMVNPSPRATMTTGLLASVDVLYLNEIESQTVWREGKISPLADPEAAVQKVLASGVATAVLTRVPSIAADHDVPAGMLPRGYRGWPTSGRHFMGTLAAFQASGQRGARYQAGT